MLMPFDSEYDLVYGEIKRHLSNKNIACNRADEIFGSVPIMNNILKETLRAHFVIADLTGQNANVFYELGISHSFKDAHNIILISQSVEDIPFDIRHLSTIIYSKDNLKHLTANIEKTINDNQHYFNFYESLQKKSIISLVHDDKDIFLEILEDHFGSSLKQVSDILDGNATSYSEDSIRSILDAHLNIIYSISSSTSKEHIKGVMKILGAVLSECSSFACAKEMTHHLLYEIKLENYDLDIRQIVSLQADLAVMLASNNVYFNEVMTWIISYFSKSKSATVDLNRYSLERFLLTSSNTEVDNIIVNSILHENQYIREHMADIAGEKSIFSAVDPLSIQLKREGNIYASSSIITALGRLGDKKSCVNIMEWFLSNKEKIIRTQHYFILKHIYKSLIELDEPNEFTKEFHSEFSEHLGPLAIF